MPIPLRVENLQQIVTAFQRDGVVILTDVDPAPGCILTEMLSSQTGLSPGQIQAAGRLGAPEISAEVRQRLARGEVTPALQRAGLDAFGDILTRLVGPMVHVSRDFHYQMKVRSQSDVIRHGYHGDGREVQALYGIHNEFTAARVVTSPSAVVCWIPLNTFEGKAIYFYPGSHRKGMLANRWLPRHEQCEGIERVGPVLEYQPRLGEVVLFHFLTLHGSGSAESTPVPPGTQPTRISCDLRFFPFMGILESPAHCLTPRPLEWIRRRIEETPDDLLRAPLYEALAYLGQPIDWPALPDHSVAHWARFVEGLVRGDSAVRHDAIAHLANTEIGYDQLGAYLERFRDLRLCRTPYASVAELVPEARGMLASIAA